MWAKLVRAANAGGEIGTSMGPATEWRCECRACLGQMVIVMGCGDGGGALHCIAGAKAASPWAVKGHQVICWQGLAGLPANE